MQPDQFNPIDLTVAGILLAGLTICGIVIKTLYNNSQARFMRVENKLEECEKDRIALWQKQAENYHQIMKVLGEMSINRSGKS